MSRLSSSHDILETWTSVAHHSTTYYDSPISNLPPEVLLAIFELVAPSRTREDMYFLLGLTHVCRDWRIWLIAYPQAWTTIFATSQDRRGFVEMCLECSQGQPLEVTVDVNDKLWVPSGCGCKNNGYGKLLPNEQSPCEWHFSFELLAQPSVSERIRVLRITSSSQVHIPSCISESRIEMLRIDFPSLLTHPSISERIPPNYSWSPVLDLNKCRFFRSTFQQLATLIWKDDATDYSRLLFSTPGSLPELKSIAFNGRWQKSLPLSQIKNLTSSTIKSNLYTLTADEFRSFLSNNLSLVSLEVSAVIRGQTDGDPVVLPNLKSLSVDCDPKALSSILQVPAFQHFSTLRVSLENGRDDLYTLRAAGEDVLLCAKSKALKVREDWQHLTGHSKPTIRRVCVYDDRLEVLPSPNNSCTEITALMENAHTVHIGLTYSGGWDSRFWDELKLLGELSVIRFEVSEEMIPYGEPLDPDDDLSDLDLLWDRIADLAEHRFKERRPLRAVERMVVSKDGEIDRLQDVLWRRFFDGKNIKNYLCAEGWRRDR